MVHQMTIDGKQEITLDRLAKENEVTKRIYTDYNTIILMVNNLTKATQGRTTKKIVTKGVMRNFNNTYRRKSQ